MSDMYERSPESIAAQARGYRTEKVTRFQIDLLVGLLREGGVDREHACEFSYLWDHVSWPYGCAALQMRNFDRACAALERKGLAASDVDEGRGIYLTPAGLILAETERDRRRARNVR